jgi:hypothetical protein
MTLVMVLVALPCSRHGPRCGSRWLSLGPGMLALVGSALALVGSRRGYIVSSSFLVEPQMTSCGGTLRTSVPGLQAGPASSYGVEARLGLQLFGARSCLFWA